MTSSSGFLRGLAAALVLAFLTWPALTRAQAILDNEVVDPRSFGYVVGDKIRREARLSVHSDYRLDEASLPEAGRLNRWLEVAAPDVRVESIRNGRRYVLVLTYQIFNAPPAPETVTIPQQNLRVIGETHALTTLVPALRVTVGPVTAGAGRLAVSALQQDRAPAPIPVEGRERRLAWSVAALLTLLLYASARRGFAAVSARRNLPFAGAVRKLQRFQRAEETGAQFGSGLKIVHEAINRTAGHAVFAHNLDDFLAAHPRYAGLRADFEELFAWSDSLFFAGTAAAPPSDCAWPALLRLCRHCGKVERQASELRPSETHR